MKARSYIAIDLKSFYASVECRERGLDPLDTNLVVADESRTDKTICLAVTPSLKSYGISGRGRLFEVKQRVKEANAGRQHDAPGYRLDGTSHLCTRTVIEIEKCKSNPKFETVALISEEMDISLDGIVFHDRAPQTVAKCVIDYFAGKSDAESQKYIDLCMSADKLK